MAATVEVEHAPPRGVRGTVPLEVFQSRLVLRVCHAGKQRGNDALGCILVKNGGKTVDKIYSHVPQSPKQSQKP